ncbi:MAG: PilZ domain-containing protein [Planctomycetota bacterium]
MAFFGFNERLRLDAEKPDDRRRAGRLVCGDLRCGVGRIRDLSGTGMRVARGPLKGEMKKGRIFAFRMQDEMGGFVVRARVVWMKRTGVFGREIGIRFTDLGQAERARIASMARISASTRMLEGPRRRAG